MVLGNPGIIASDAIVEFTIFKALKAYLTAIRTEILLDFIFQKDKR